MILYDSSQLNRGILEGCILSIINNNCTYGYDIIIQLENVGFREIKESTIYPLLVRLEKKGFVTSHYEPSPLGPIRKYYHITIHGTAYLNEFIDHWRKIEKQVNFILERSS